MAECFFNCGLAEQALTAAGAVRIRKIIESSKLRCDNLHIELSNQLEENCDLTINCHRSCVSTYTSSSHITRHRKRLGLEPERSPNESSPPKRTRRSETPHYSFQDHCIFCGEICMMDKDPRNPSRWRQATSNPGRSEWKR
jgi:hypothetical protein